MKNPKCQLQICHAKALLKFNQSLWNRWNPYSDSIQPLLNLVLVMHPFHIIHHHIYTHMCWIKRRCPYLCKSDQNSKCQITIWPLFFQHIQFIQIQHLNLWLDRIIPASFKTFQVWYWLSIQHICAFTSSYCKILIRGFC